MCMLCAGHDSLPSPTPTKVQQLHPAGVGGHPSNIRERVNQSARPILSRSTTRLKKRVKNGMVDGFQIKSGPATSSTKCCSTQLVMTVVFPALLYAVNCSYWCTSFGLLFGPLNNVPFNQRRFLAEAFKRENTLTER